MAGSMLTENKGMVLTAVLIVFLGFGIFYLTDNGLFPIGDDGSQTPQNESESEPVQNTSEDDAIDEPENPLNETEQTGEVVGDYNNSKQGTDSGNNYDLSLQSPPNRGGVTDIYFKVNGEGVENSPIYIDGEYQRDTQEGLSAGRSFLNVPNKEEFEISIEFEGENYSETFETVEE